MTTTVTTPTTDLAIAHVPTGIVERIAAAVRARLARMRARHEARTLLGCQDNMLRDMGVNRADVEATLFNSYH